MKYPLAMLCLASSISAAEIYKCTDDKGSIMFSDHECADNAEHVDITAASSGIQMGAQGDWTGTINANRAREKERAIDNHHRAIDQLMSARGARLEQLRRDQSRANNNAAGAAYRQSLATEMQAVTSDFNARIDAERRAIADLESQ